MNRNFLKGILALFLAATLICVLMVVNLKRLAVFSVNRFSGHQISYAGWRGNPLGRSTMEGLSVILEGGGSISAERALLVLDAGKLLREHAVVLYCELSGARFVPESGETVSPEGVMAAVYDPSLKYEKVKFNLFLDDDITSVSGFGADSTDMRLNGDYTLLRGSDNINVDLKISFSPTAVRAMDEVVVEKMLYPDENGWYSTAINYKGNALFLRALYSLSTK